VVDGSAASREVLCQLLTMLGAEAVAVEDAAAAVDMLTQPSGAGFRWVIAEGKCLEGSTGMANTLRERAAQCGATLILMGGPQTNDACRDMVNSGAATYLPKPIGLRQLLRALTKPV